METSRGELAARIAAVPIPRHMAGRPIDGRGFPVPYFVAWLDEQGNEMPEGQGRPDHRVVDVAKMARCVKLGLCWLCGHTLGRWRALVVGPMCLVNRTTPEPDSHVDCAEYAARACPFLANERARRRAGPNDWKHASAPESPVPIVVEASDHRQALPEGTVRHPAGHSRNPGVACVFVHHERWLKRMSQGPGLPPLFRMPPGEPHRLTFWANGVPATRAQVMRSLDSGLVILREQAERQAIDGATTELACYYAATVALVDRWTPEPELEAAP